LPSGNTRAIIKSAEGIGFLVWKPIIKGGKMGSELKELLAAAKKATPSEEQKEEQRRSFAFGNTNIENSRITRETIDKEAEELKRA
jgi:hypothetical protein